MICLRSGYCCISLDVIIVDDPDKGICDDNVIHKPSGVACKHLLGTQFSHSCAIHDKPWYKKTPCAQYTQIESENSPCRTGKYLKDKAATQGIVT